VTDSEILDYIDTFAEVYQDRHPERVGGVILILTLRPLPGMLDSWTVGAPNGLRALIAGQPSRRETPS
jgi:hypothetical protein